MLFCECERRAFKCVQIMSDLYSYAGLPITRMRLFNRRLIPPASLFRLTSTWCVCDGVKQSIPAKGGERRWCEWDYRRPFLGYFSFIRLLWRGGAYCKCIYFCVLLSSFKSLSNAGGRRQCRFVHLPRKANDFRILSAEKISDVL